MAASKRLFGLSILVLALGIALSNTPLFAEETVPGAVPAAAAVPAPVQDGCGSDLSLLEPSAAKGEVCPASLPGSPEPEFMASPVRARTCRCSCGHPCKTDADCGPGGSCRAGITCC